MHCNGNGSKLKCMPPVVDGTGYWTDKETRTMWDDSPAIRLHFLILHVQFSLAFYLSFYFFMWLESDARCIVFTERTNITNRTMATRHRKGKHKCRRVSIFYSPDVLFHDLVALEFKRVSRSNGSGSQVWKIATKTFLCKHTKPTNFTFSASTMPFTYTVVHSVSFLTKLTK